MIAPWHYVSTTDGGKPAFGIDELPLEWCLQPGGGELDLRELPDGHVVSWSSPLKVRTPRPS